MKKITILFAALMTAFSFVSCNKEVAPVQSEPEKKAIKFNITVGDMVSGTRAAKTGWVNGDKINIWFDGSFEKTPDLVITYNNGSWDAGDLRDGVELKESDGKLVALYESTNDLSKYSATRYPDRSYVKFGYDTSRSVDGSSMRVVSPTSMVASCNAVEYQYSSENTVLSAELRSWYFHQGIQITITGIPDGNYALNSAVMKQLIGFDVKDNSLLSLNYATGNNYVEGIASNGEAVFYLRSFYDFDNSESLSFTLIPQKDGQYSSSNALKYKVDGSRTVKGTSYQAFKISYNKFKASINGHEYVDMGDGLKWATMNVGASSETDYGDYFAWGETDSKDVYAWNTYKWSNAVEYDDYTKLTKYCTANGKEFWNSEGAPDGKTVLDPDDDAARANWGGSWRMPTAAEWEELLFDCNWTWTTQNGVNGYRVTSNEDQSIFLPAAGRRPSSSPDYGPGGFYWSSSLYEYEPCGAWYIVFNSDANAMRLNSFYRSYGFSVRPVSD